MKFKFLIILTIILLIIVSGLLFFNKKDELNVSKVSLDNLEIKNIIKPINLDNKIIIQKLSDVKLICQSIGCKIKGNIISYQYQLLGKDLEVSFNIQDQLYEENSLKFTGFGTISTVIKNIPKEYEYSAELLFELKSSTDGEKIMEINTHVKSAIIQVASNRVKDYFIEFTMVNISKEFIDKILKDINIIQ